MNSAPGTQYLRVLTRCWDLYSVPMKTCSQVPLGSMRLLRARRRAQSTEGARERTLSLALWAASCEVSKSYPCEDGGGGGADTVEKWKCTTKETKVLCAQDMTNHSVGRAGNVGAWNDRSQGTGGSPEAKIHNRCIFRWGQDVSQEKTKMWL